MTVDYAKAVLELSRNRVRVATGILTGHCHFGKHTVGMGLKQNGYGRFCRTEVVCVPFDSVVVEFRDGVFVSLIHLRSFRCFFFHGSSHE